MLDDAPASRDRSGAGRLDRCGRVSTQAPARELLSLGALDAPHLRARCTAMSQVQGAPEAAGARRRRPQHRPIPQEHRGAIAPACPGPTSRAWCGCLFTAPYNPAL